MLHELFVKSQHELLFWDLGLYSEKLHMTFWFEAVIDSEA